MPIIEVKNLTKEYQLGSIVSLKQSTVNIFNKLTGRPVVERERFKALDDISFTIDEGEVVGIIGQNGAGKSTLLKHLASITKPTKGEVIVRGSIAPLIEVGAGVNPELTGRENIFLNGAILGIPKKVINQKLDEIIDFSELEQFIDTPVKRYSSGMTVRLGFSIATSMDADILIVDEVLAVGDLAFQRKCFDRMGDIIKHRGKTVLLVSHNIRQVERLCSRVLLLHGGQIEMDAEPRSVCTTFYDASNEKIQKQQVGAFSSKHIESSGEILLDQILSYSPDSQNIPTNAFKMHSPVTVELDFTAKLDLENLEIVVGVHTTDFIYLFSATTASDNSSLTMKKGKNSIVYHFADMMLTPGVYSLRLAVRDQMGSMLWYGENLHPIKITPGSRNIASIPKLGIMDVPYKWYLNTHAAS